MSAQLTSNYHGLLTQAGVRRDPARHMDEDAEFGFGGRAEQAWLAAKDACDEKTRTDFPETCAILRGPCSDVESFKGQAVEARENQG